MNLDDGYRAGNDGIDIGLSSSIPPEFEIVDEATPIFIQIVHQLIDAIEKGALPLGSRLPSEMVLSRQFGVSRASVREALSSLQFAGYIESRRGSGSVVTSTVPRGAPRFWEKKLERSANIVDLLEARLAIEPEAIRQAASNPIPSALTSLKQLLEGMKLSVSFPELNARTDLGIHIALVRTCRNPFLAQASEQLLHSSEGGILTKVRDHAWGGRQPARAWLGHHEVITKAIMERDPYRAETEMRRHLLSVLETLLQSQTLPVSDHDRAKVLFARHSDQVDEFP